MCPLERRRAARCSPSCRSGGRREACCLCSLILWYWARSVCHAHRRIPYVHARYRRTRMCVRIGTCGASCRRDTHGDVWCISGSSLAMAIRIAIWNLKLNYCSVRSVMNVFNVFGWCVSGWRTNSRRLPHAVQWSNDRVAAQGETCVFHRVRITLVHRDGSHRLSHGIALP